MNIAKTIVLTGLILGVAGINIDSAKAGDAAPSWSGFYAGANIGYGWGSGDVGVLPVAPAVIPPDFPDIQQFIDALRASGSFPTSLSPSEHGFTGGGQVGYNWELPSNWVVGIEADLQASGMKDSDTQGRTPQFFDETSTTVSKKVEWFGTVRGRAGYLVNPDWLIFATGGIAYGKTNLGFSVTDVTSGCIANATICTDQNDSGVHFGWTAGAGVEAMLASNWSVKAEYLYVDLGERSFNATTNTPVEFKVSAKYHEQIMRIGLNYHFN